MSRRDIANGLGELRKQLSQPTALDLGTQYSPRALEGRKRSDKRQQGYDDLPLWSDDQKQTDLF